MLIAQLQEQRDKKMVDAAALLRSENPTAEQVDSANQMLTDATALEKRIASLKQVEAHEAAQRNFIPAERPNGNQGTQEETVKRTRAVDALRSFMLHGKVEAEYRDVLTNGVGAPTIPTVFVKELWEAVRAFAPMLDVVDTITTYKNGAPHKFTKVNYTNTTLPVVPEAQTFPEIDPAFSNATLGVDKLGGIVKVSFEELSDSNFDLPTWLKQQFQLIYGYSLEAYVTNSDAAAGGTNIAGLVPLFATGPTSTATDALAYQDVAGLFGGLTQAYARNASFMMSTSTRAYLMGLIATTGAPIFDVSPANGPFSSIFGRPVVINDSMPSMASGNVPILFGDFKLGYLLRIDGDPEIKQLNERYADTDEVGFIIRTRVGGCSKAAGIAPIKGITLK